MREHMVDVMTPATGMSKVGLFWLYLRLMVAVLKVNVSLGPGSWDTVKKTHVPANLTAKTTKK